MKVVRSKFRYKTYNPLKSVGSHARSCLPVANVIPAYSWFVSLPLFNSLNEFLALVSNLF